MQRQGHYPPPPGASAYPGLECSGVISAIGPGVTGHRVGERVCALLAGGGYAERVAVPAGQLLPMPQGMSVQEAAALPEVACTVWSNVVDIARLRKGETLLVHGGGSGIGTFAIQLGKALGATVIVTARAAKHDELRELGADLADRLHDRRLRGGDQGIHRRARRRRGARHHRREISGPQHRRAGHRTAGSRSSACRAAGAASSTWAR